MHKISPPEKVSSFQSSWSDLRGDVGGEQGPNHSSSSSPSSSPSSSSSHVFSFFEAFLLFEKSTKTFAHDNGGGRGVSLCFKTGRHCCLRETRLWLHGGTRSLVGLPDVCFLNGGELWSRSQNR
mmetsp:Transcript_40263/g.104404  ORF Transcript_40263/g.104404 Transcript_40263/m.104404 type:complete len:124 (-) Transcript_40263:825-1196(-)